MNELVIEKIIDFWDTGEHDLEKMKKEKNLTQKEIEDNIVFAVNYAFNNFCKKSCIDSKKSYKPTWSE